MNFAGSMLPKLSALLLLTACSVPPIPPGTYSFSSDDLHESLVLSGDGSFTQDITIGASPYHAAGTWTHRESNRVEFRTFLVRFDTRNGATIDPPKEYLYYIGYWQPNRRQIVFDDDSHYYLAAGSLATPAPK